MYTSLLYKLTYQKNIASNKQQMYFSDIIMLQGHTKEK